MSLQLECQNVDMLSLHPRVQQLLTNNNVFMFFKEQCVRTHGGKNEQEFRVVLLDDASLFDTARENGMLLDTATDKSMNYYLSFLFHPCPTLSPHHKTAFLRTIKTKTALRVSDQSVTWGHFLLTIFLKLHSEFVSPLWHRYQRLWAFINNMFIFTYGANDRMLPQKRTNGIHLERAFYTAK